MTNQEESLLLARFLIEENDQIYIDFDPQSSKNIHIIKSIFKNITGNYTIYTETEINDFLLNFKKFFQDNYTFLQEALKTILPKR